MSHERILRTVLGVTAGYVILLALWAGWLVQHTPPGTVQYQVAGLIGLYGSLVGIGMMVANRPTRSERRLRKHGLEGWARIEDARPLRRTDHHTELTELELRLTVPGSESYSGRVILDVAPIDKSRFAIGETVTVRVDPQNRDRIILCP